MGSQKGIHHLDRRAADLAGAAVGSNADDLLSTVELARWLGVSPQWAEIGRHKGYGPPFKRVGPGRIRYRRGDVADWLEERTFSHTAEYGKLGA